MKGPSSLDTEDLMFSERVGLDEIGKGVGHATLRRNILTLVQDMQCRIRIVGYLYLDTTWHPTDEDLHGPHDYA